MELPTVLASLGITAQAPTIARGWEESVQSRPPGEIFFLKEKFIQAGCQYLGLPADVRELAGQTAQRIRIDPALAALIWHAHCRLYRGGPGIGNWPLLTESLGGAAGVFYFLVLLSNHPNTRALHEAHAIPASIVADTMSAVFYFLQKYQKRTGQYGLTPLDCDGWLSIHLRGDLYQLGRLEFIYKKFPKGCVAFRNQQNQRVIALAEGGLEFRRDGQKNGASGITETEGVWISELQRDGDFISGHPIDPVRGATAQQQVRLPSAAWKEILRPGDPVLDIHIPATSPITRQDCAESVHRAVEFFQKHFPEKPAARALHCNSWILDAQLAHHLKPDSNIINFQQQFYLYPTDCDPWSIVRFIFNIDIPYGQIGGINLKTLPHRIALEKAVVAHLATGGHWRKAGGFIMIEDLPWGRAMYRQPPQL